MARAEIQVRPFHLEFVFPKSYHNLSSFSIQQLHFPRGKLVQMLATNSLHAYVNLLNHSFA